MAGLVSLPRFRQPNYRAPICRASLPSTTDQQKDINVNAFRPFILRALLLGGSRDRGEKGFLGGNDCVWCFDCRGRLSRGCTVIMYETAALYMCKWPLAHPAAPLVFHGDAIQPRAHGMRQSDKDGD